uniref:Tax1-binding protein 1 n=1 Tax=Lygus hesperus TaxID=30085 RepID=A0A146KW39_LYGHE
MFDNREKIILDLVTFDDIKINYCLARDLQVIFTIDPSVSASTRDWIGVYQAGWNSFESCLTFQWGIGRHYKNACRTRSLTFKARDLAKAKCGTHYQFVYVSRYLEILGVSQYFQFSNVETPLRRPVSAMRSKSADSVSPFSCKLTLPDRVNNVFTSCGKCEGLFELKEVAKSCKETSFSLAAKVTNLEQSVSNLENLPRTPLVRFWNEESERARFETFISKVYLTPKPDCSGEKSVLADDDSGRAGVLKHLLSAMDDIITKANEVKSCLLKWNEGGNEGLIDPNASGILPIPETSEEHVTSEEQLICESKPEKLEN